MASVSAVAVPAAGRMSAVRSLSSTVAHKAFHGLALPRPTVSRWVRRTAVCRGSVTQAVLPGSDPSILDHLAAHATPLFTLADSVAPAMTAEQAAEAPARVTGPLTPLANAMEGVLQLLDTGLEKLHVPYSYGFAIIMLTVLVKAATFPLSQKQVESTAAMQALQPRIKALQEMYKNDQEKLQLETAKLYKEAGVNPLAGCLPTLATIPVFIGLYRALSNAADDGLLTEGFFWIPSLGGPTTMAARASGTGSNWLFPFVDGQPPIGWHDALSYLVLPVLLVCSQFASQKIMQPASANTDDPAQQQTQAILKFLPLMIGWFSLNVPSGLTLYWITNNVLTTSQSLYLKSRKNPALEAIANAPAVPLGTTTIVKEEATATKKPSGKDTGARRKKGDKFKKLKEAEKARKLGAAGAAAKAAELAASDKSPKDAIVEAAASVTGESSKEDASQN